MKILSIISITFLIIFAAGCDEMQNQVMKPVMMPDDETPPEDSTVTSVGTMKDPSTETDGTKEDPSTETDDSEEESSDEPETMEEDPPDEPQIPDAAFVSASPASGNIKENDSITITFDNDPGDVTVSSGTVSGSGNSRTISGPFSVGSLALVISWPNGSGSHTLNYNVESPPVVPQIPDAAFVSASPASGDISENDSITITFDNDPGTVTVSFGTVSGSGNSRTISGPFPVGSLTLTISWTNGSGSHTLNYNVMAEDNTSPNVTTSSTADGAKDVDPETVSENGITVTFSEPISSGVLKLYKDGSDVGWTATISGNTITLTANAGQELNHGTTYQISGTVRDSTGNETDVSITFTTESAPAPEPLAAGEGLRIGVKAPTFSLPDGDGNTHSLSDSIGSSKIVIVFFRGGW